MSHLPVREASRKSSASLHTQYAEALREYRENRNDAALQRACELGQLVSDQGAGAIEMIAIHHDAMIGALLEKIGSGGQSFTGALEALEIFCSTCPAWHYVPDVKTKYCGGVADLLRKTLSPIGETQRNLETSNAALLRLSEAREQEAKRIAHALHDEAAQLLASAHLALEEAAREMEPFQAERLRSVRQVLDEIENRLRSLSHELRPTILDDLGLAAALKVLTEGVSKRTGLVIELECAASIRLPAVVETTLYRMVQECLNNVCRHARATRANVRFSQSAESIICSVMDDGVGFEPSKTLDETGGLGLVGIKERIEALGGKLSIVTSPGTGTEVEVTAPCSLQHRTAQVGANCRV